MNSKITSKCILLPSGNQIMFRANPRDNDPFFQDNIADIPIYVCTINRNGEGRYCGISFGDSPFQVHYETVSGRQKFTYTATYSERFGCYLYYDHTYTINDPTEFYYPVYTEAELETKTQVYIPVIWNSKYRTEQYSALFGITVTS